MKTLLKAEKKNVCVVINPPHDAPTKTAVVLGVQRGGTSMAAGVLRALGVDMGKTGLNHEDARFLSATAGQLSKVIKKRNAEKDVWGFKAPEVTLKLDFLTRNLRSPYYICVLRNIAAVIDSVTVRRGGQGDPKGVLRRVLKYYNRIGKLVREEEAPIILVNYERAAANPEQFVDDMIAFLQLDVTAETRQAAIGMVTGDGGGYLNLPSEYFHVGLSEEPGEATAVDKTLAIKPDGDGAVEIKAKDGDLPKLVRVKLDLSPGTPVRFSFRFDDRYSHRLSQEVKSDADGWFDLETLGTCKGCRVSLGEDAGVELKVAAASVG